MNKRLLDRKFHEGGGMENSQYQMANHGIGLDQTSYYETVLKAMKENEPTGNVAWFLGRLQAARRRDDEQALG